MEREPGTLFVIAAPSGTGKSTLARRLLAEDPNLRFSVSFTTRPPRDGEQEGVDYRFVDVNRFQSKIDAGGFLEWAKVYGNFYGTGLTESKEALATGADLLLDIDVQGARQVRENRALGSVSVMILPPDRQTLELRLRGRGTESEQVVARRLAAAAEEVAEYRNFDYLVVNHSLEDTVATVQAIVAAERSRGFRRAAQAEAIVESFRRSR